MGAVNFPVSCSPKAQVEFNRAVTLLHHMTYPQARAAFQNVTTIDSGCAMAHWGVAMTLFQPLWPTRPGPRRSAKRLAGSGDRQVAGAADTARTAFHQRG